MRTDLIQLTDIVKYYFIPTSFIEVGSRNGHDTKHVYEYWNLSPRNCYIVEPDPISYNKIINDYGDKFSILNIAASDINGEMDFNSVTLNNDEARGMSSFKKSIFVGTLRYQTVKVKSVRLDTLQSFDLMKIDVEGHGYEVLVGLGDKIKDVKGIQIETESIACFENQKIDLDIHNYLDANGFELVDKRRCWNVQYDCLYINKKLKPTIN
jgi:FkbM family methyltransferase